MGLDVKVYLVAGVDLATHYRKDKRPETITKYHEDTGQPYQKNITQTVHRLGNLQMEENEWTAFQTECGTDDGLQFYSLSNVDDDPVVLGVCIAATDSYRMAKKAQLTPGQIAAGCEQAKELLKRFGLENEVKIYMIPYASV